MSADQPAREAGLLVHGMGSELVQPDWSPLTDAEVRAVLARYPSRGGAGTSAAARVTWRSPRPMSAAALVRCGAGAVFVKRHNQRVRTVAQLAAEHAFARHLRRRGIVTPAVLQTSDGQSTVSCHDSVYEVHAAAPGVDLYRDAMSWTPFTSLGHAHAAGTALARLHRAAADFGPPPRPPAVLTSSCAIITALDPVEAVGPARRPPSGPGTLPVRPPVGRGPHPPSPAGHPPGRAAAAGGAFAVGPR